jgi:hypothetical protein
MSELKLRPPLPSTFSASLKSFLTLVRREKGLGESETLRELDFRGRFAIRQAFPVLLRASA